MGWHVSISMWKERKRARELLEARGELDAWVRIMERLEGTWWWKQKDLLV